MSQKIRFFSSDSTSIVCENGILQLECPDNQFINLLEANFGRTVKGDVCHCKEGTSIAAGTCPTDPSASNVDDCISSNTLSILNSPCNGKRECTLNVNHFIFGDPCGGIHKYLEVHYNCYGNIV